MKSIEITNTSVGEERKITLSDYYSNLPSFSAPKKNFITEICERCEVNENTARNWMSGRSKPQKASHYRILSEMTGINEEDLFME